MTVLVTGCAGFIGYHVARALLARGDPVLGVDNLNPYYDPALKQARLERLRAHPGFAFERADIADLGAITALARRHRDPTPGRDQTAGRDPASGSDPISGKDQTSGRDPTSGRDQTAGRDPISGVVHLAAQAGVRHSLEAPFDYIQSNLQGHMVILEVCRRELPALRHLVYASSSSVYGGNTKTPFAVEDRVDQPISLYAATKRADELLSHCYSHLYGLPATGLRFFTVYGPWGRPDMAAFLFADAITAGRPITLYNRGEMERDFTYIDDIVAGVLAALDRPPAAGEQAPHRLYNLGNHRPVALRHFVAVLEQALGRQALIELAPLPPGDVVRTSADIEASRRDLGFEPKTPIEDGLPRFVAWYREYHGV